MIARIVLFVVVSLTSSVGGMAQDARLIGIDANYALDMARHDKSWKDRSGPVEPFVLFAEHGCRDARIRL